MEADGRRPTREESDRFVGVPGIIGRNGVEKVIELDLTAEEKAAFEHSVGAVSKTCSEVDTMLKNL